MSSESKPWQDEELLREKYWSEGLSTVEIGEEYGCSSMTIHYWMDKFGISRRDSGKRENAPWKDEDLLRDLYCNQNLTTYEIADKFDCDPSNISYWLKKFDIEIDQYTSMIAAEELQNESYLRDAYLDNGMSCNEIASKLDVCHTTVLNALHSFDIDVRKTSHVAEKHWNWQGGIAKDSPDFGDNWEQQRRKALERDNRTCQSCGKHESDLDNWITVHHIFPRSDFRDEDGNLDYERANNLPNLITLCIPCHREWEGLYLRPDTR